MDLAGARGASRFSNAEDGVNCVEAAVLPSGVAVRDTKDRTLAPYTATEWDTFVAGVRVGEFDTPRP